MRSVTPHNILVPSHAALVTISGLEMLRAPGMPVSLSSGTFTFRDRDGR